MGWMNRLRNLLRSVELDEELDEEFQFHLDARIRDNIKAGMVPGDARKDAIRRFGNRTLAKELTRERDLFAPIESIGQDLRYAFRGLRANPGFTATAILILALGIGANTAVFTVVNGVLLRPLPFPEPGRLFSISDVPREGPFFLGRGMEDYRYLEFRRQDRQFENIASFTMYPAALTGAGEPVRLATAAVTPEFLNVLRVNPLAGRDFLPDEGQPGRTDVVILSHEVWQTRFGGNPSILGQAVTLDGLIHTVIGIMPPNFSFPSGAKLWIPLEIRLQHGKTFARPVIGRLKPDVSAAQAQAALETFAATSPADTRERRDLMARIIPLKDVVVGSVRKSLLIFAGAVMFVLLIACANVANLLLIRAAKRRNEVSVRAVLGASRWRLVRQLVTESTLISIAGGAAGILLAVEGVPALLALAPEGTIPRLDQVHLDWTVLVFTIGLSVLTGVVFGLAPAFQATRRELRESLAESGRTVAASNANLRGMLVVSEIALALVLLTGAGLLLKSFWRIHSVDPGFRAGKVLTVTVDLPDSRYPTAAEMRDFHQRTLAKLTTLPGAASVAAVNWLPLGQGLIRGGFRLEGGRQLPEGYTVDKLVISAGYFRTMGIQLFAGREFTPRDDSVAPGAVIVSQSVARTLWSTKDAVGRRIALESHPRPHDWLTVVGVVDDIRQTGLTTNPSPAVYQPFLQENYPFGLSHMTFAVRTALDPTALASGIRGALQQIDPDQPVESITTMEEIAARTTAEPRFQTQLLLTFSIIALLLSTIGIYGVLGCSVAERTHEIGIRMALGAGTGDVVRMVIRRTLALAGIGLTLGTAGALALTRVLEGFLFEVSPTDPATFAAVAFVVTATALGASLFPARRASKVEPLIALRHQ